MPNLPIGRWRSLFFHLAVLALLLVGTARRVAAQDILLDLNGVETPVQVLEITPTQVLYRTPDTDPALPPSIVDKKALFMVKFANGNREVFGPVPTPAPATTPDAPPAPAGSGTAGSTFIVLTPAEQAAQLELRGRADADRYYDRSGARWSTVALTAVSFGSLLPAVVIGVVRPKAYKNPSLDRNLLQYPAYVHGYERRAHQRKIGPVVGGYFLGILGAVVLYGALLGR